MSTCVIDASYLATGSDGTKYTASVRRRCDLVKVKDATGPGTCAVLLEHLKSACMPSWREASTSSQYPAHPLNVGQGA